MIKNKDIDDLKICIEKYKTFKGKTFGSLLVGLNSKGGDVVAAMEMGKILREHRAWIWVFPGSECSSACVLILAGGMDRNICNETKIGVHRPIFNEEYFSNLDFDDATKLYTKLTDELHSYLLNMGIKDSLFEKMMSIKSNEVEYLSNDYSKKVGLDGKDPAYEEWQRAKTVQNWGKKYVIWWDIMNECFKPRGPSGLDYCSDYVRSACDNDKNFSQDECDAIDLKLRFPNLFKATIEEIIDRGRDPKRHAEILKIIEEIEKGKK